MLEEAYRIRRNFGERLVIADLLSCFAATLAFAGRAETAARLLSSSEALQDELGTTPPWVADRNKETLTSVRTELDEAIFAGAWEGGKTLAADAAVALALASLD